MAKPDKNILAQIERNEKYRWFETYIKQVEGYAALAENLSEGCDEEWMAMHFGLNALAKLMREDLELQKKEMA